MSEPQVDLWIASLDLPTPELERGRGRLPPEAVERADRGVTPQLRRRALAGEILRREVLSTYLECAPEEVRLAASPSGKPEVTDAPHLHFSLSHSGGILALAVSRDGRVGVDVELLRAVRHPEHLARRYFTPEEAMQVIAAGDGDRDALFLRYWTRTEALLKARGIGLHDPRPEDVEWSDGWWVRDILPGESGLPEGACLAVAVEGTRPRTIRLRRLAPS